MKMRSLPPRMRLWRYLFLLVAASALPLLGWTAFREGWIGVSTGNTYWECWINFNSIAIDEFEMPTNKFSFECNTGPANVDWKHLVAEGQPAYLDEPSKTYDVRFCGFRTARITYPKATVYYGQIPILFLILLGVLPAVRLLEIRQYRKRTRTQGFEVAEIVGPIKET